MPIKQSFIDSHPIEYFQRVYTECRSFIDTFTRNLKDVEAKATSLRSKLKEYKGIEKDLEEVIKCKTTIVKRSKPITRYNYRGESMTVYELQQLATNDITRSALHYRLKRGMSPEVALTKPVRERRYI